MQACPINFTAQSIREVSILSFALQANKLSKSMSEEKLFNLIWIVQRFSFKDSIEHSESTSEYSVMVDLTP